MVKQILLPIIAVAVFIAAVGIFIQKSSTLKLGNVSVSPMATTAPTPGKVVTVAGKAINVEIANTFELRSKGLSGRSTLDPNAGMLFVFDTKNVTPGFWMKDMLIPLDLIWINDGAVVKIDKNVPAPAPGTLEGQLRIYTPGMPIDYVLEVNGGFSDTNGIRVGLPVALPTL